jgi:acetyltransferase-like isoleucine patch superfamily enzyme
MNSFKKNIYLGLEKYPQLREVLTWVYTIIASKGNRKNISGSNNIVQANSSILKNVIFDIVGNNNTIFIDKESQLNGVTIFMRGSNHNIHIGKRCKFNRGSSLWFEDNNCVLKIGDNTSIEDAHIALTEPNSQIHIGSDCMLAYDIDIRSGDSHSIIDLETRKRINCAKNIEIQNHVWIAAHTRILKGVIIQENSVVATGAIVTKNVPANSIVAGNPAKVVKTGITWDRQRIYDDSLLLDKDRKLK